MRVTSCSTQASTSRSTVRSSQLYSTGPHSIINSRLLQNSQPRGPMSHPDTGDKRDRTLHSSCSSPHGGGGKLLNRKPCVRFFPAHKTHKGRDIFHMHFISCSVSIVVTEPLYFNIAEEKNTPCSDSQVSKARVLFTLRIRQLWRIAWL